MITYVLVLSNMTKNFTLNSNKYYGIDKPISDLTNTLFLKYQYNFHFS